MAAQYDRAAVAIVAAAGRFPGARDVDAFWRNLCAGAESIRRYSDAELAAAGVPEALRAHAKFVPVGALLDDVDQFDAELFGFSPREAALLDPQHRLFFECVWEALERAGYPPGRVTDPIGVFAGTSISTYLINNLIPEREAIRRAGVYQAYITNDKDSLTTHVAYKLNCRGPSVTLQTACSTSLVATHFACQSLVGFGCDLAVAGGVSVQIPHQPGYVHQEGAILSPDGHCRAFDADAAGTVPGSGVGVVVLKRFEDARRDGDPILAVIRGGAVNNDGSAKVGYTAPGVDGQTEAIALALAVADVPPETVGYVEAHGTGTPLGDPIEVTALTRVFRGRADRPGSCALGAVKTNIGHLDAAAGVAGLIKAALAVQHGVIPPTLHFRRPNPRIDLQRGPFFVPTTLVTDWPVAGFPRRAGVSSFGIGGTNAHIVLEQAPASSSGSSRPVQVLALSARSAESLDRLADDVAQRLRDPASPPLADAAFTLHVGRRTWPHRAATACRTVAEAVEALQTDSPRVRRGVSTDRSRVAFVFPGQGAQFPGMGRALYEQEPTFRDELDGCCARLQPVVGTDLRQLVIWGDPSDPDARAALASTALAQPALFAFEYALARLWISWGVEPDALLGHSLGEYVAACLANAFSLDDALKVVAVRGRLMQALPAGAMVAVGATEAETAALLEEDVAIAAVNGARAVVASGPEPAIARLIETLAARRLPHRRLETSHAFHSAMMEPMLAAFGQEIADLSLGTPTVPVVSNLTGTWMSAEAATSPEYWVRHVRGTVRFSDGLATLQSDPARVILEVGPGRALSRLAGSRAVASVGDRDEHAASAMVLADALARVWVEGVDVDWRAYYARERRHRVLMPTTPFERRRHWIEPPPIAESASPPPTEPLAGASIGSDTNGGRLYVTAWAESAAPAGTTEESVAIVGGPPDLARILADRLHGRVGSIVIAERLAGDVNVSRICYLGTMAERAAPADEAALRRTAFDEPLALARALGERDMRAPVQLVFVTNLIDGPRSFAPLRALATGPVLVIPQEYPHISCRAIDVDVESPSRDIGWAEDVVRELTSSATDRLVAYREGRRHTRIVAPAPLSTPPGQPRLRPGGVYWITGAAGAIGRSLAEHLAHRYQATLVLTSRRPLSAAFVESLEAAGATVSAHVADCADAIAMQAVASRALASASRLDGIIHAAGVPGGGLIARHSLEAFHQTLRPKVDGTRVVARLAQAFEARVVVLCSSLSTLQGSLGQTDYVAANAFLDAFAAWHTRESGIPTISVGWDAWREAGMAVDVAAALGRPRPTDGLTVAQGITLFEQVLASDRTHVLASARPLGDRFTAPRAAAGRVATPAALSVDTEVAQVWHQVLGVEGVGPGDNFFDVGGDSLKGLQVVALVGERFGIEVPIAHFFAAPTIDGLAALVRGATTPGDRSLDPSSERGARRSARRRVRGQS